jgi:cyclopropane-fatty-acyl-phospholipid synthase
MASSLQMLDHTLLQAEAGMVRTDRDAHGRFLACKAGRMLAAAALAPLLHALFGDEPPPVEVRFWDGSQVGPEGGTAAIVLNAPAAVRRILYAPNEIGFARAFVLGEADIEGDALEVLRIIYKQGQADLRVGVRSLLRTVLAGAQLGVLGPPLPRPAEEARLRGGRHSKSRDAAAIAHHYDVGNAFYKLVLGESMTYSCARFVNSGDSLETAQSAKYDLICRKLGLRPGLRLLDVGCGWGGMAMHAAANYQASAVGITLSQQQYELGRKRVADAGLSDRVEIRLQDYRDVTGSFDAISSIGMFEHVGKVQMARYFAVLAGVLHPGGRFLNHAISTPDGAQYDRRSFTSRYVFPDGELQDLSTVVAAMEAVDLEVRDVEALREHYPLTLRRWVDNLAAHWDEAVALVGPGRARVWKLYMLGAIVSFEMNDISVHQVLGVKTGRDGASGMPLTRTGTV